MKKMIIIALKILITLLLITPPLLLAIELINMRAIKHPQPELVRAWDIEDNTHDGRLRFVFTIREDGIVEGTVEAVGGTLGKVVMRDACLKNNRHWFSTLLHQRSDYKVEGSLASSPVKEPRGWFWIEFNCDKQGAMTRIKAGLEN